MTVLIALHEAKNQVPDVEGLVPHPSVVVPSQRLLVLGRAEEGDVASFVQLVHGVFVGCLSSLFVVCSDSWRSIVEVLWEDSLRTVDHEESACSRWPGWESSLGSRAPQGARRPSTR